MSMMDLSFLIVHFQSCFRYDALLLQNERLKMQIIAMNCTMTEKQKEVIFNIYCLDYMLFYIESVDLYVDL